MTRALCLLFMLLASSAHADDLPITPPQWRPPLPPAAPEKEKRARVQGWDKLPPGITWTFVPPPTVPPQGEAPPPPVFVPAPVVPSVIPPDPPLFYDEVIPCQTASVIFILDRSLSMQAEDVWWDEKGFIHGGGAERDPAKRTRLGKAKLELLRCVDRLAENFCFNVLFYDCTVKSFSAQVVPATAANKALLRAWVATIAPQGATGTAPACIAGLADRENTSIVLLTDGAPNCGIIPATPDQHRIEIKRANTQHATITVFGIGAWSEPALREFCQQVAGDNGGTYKEIR